MIKIIQNSLPVTIFACVLLLVQVIGCSEDADELDADGSDVSGAPPLPPDESMAVDLSLFEENVMGAPSNAMLTMRNFAYAATAASTVSSAVVAGVTPPAALFAAARLTTPVEQDDGSWVWDFSVKISGVTFAASLTGVEKLNKNQWTMKVSTNAPLRPAKDFIWYTGESTLKSVSGSWQFFDLQTPDEQNSTVNIDWSADIISEEANLTLRNVDTRDDSKYAGDVLQYNVSREIASMAFEDVSENEIWEIIWNIETGTGSVTTPGYNNGEKACWDANKKDVTCN